MLQLAQDPDADALLDRDPLALLIGMLLDQQFPMEHAFAGPGRSRATARRHRLDARALAESDPEALVTMLTRPPAMHRYPAVDGRPGAGAAPRCSSTSTTATPRGSGATSRTAPSLLRRINALPGFGDAEGADLPRAARQAARRDPAGLAGGRRASTARRASHRSIADVVDGASLVQVREFKQAAKAKKKAAATT